MNNLDAFYDAHPEPSQESEEVQDREVSLLKSLVVEQDYKEGDRVPKTYPDLESAQAAMDRGETVRIEMHPWEINPALIQLAQDLQDKERLEEFCKKEVNNAW